jgi:rare lipoprotein A
MRNIVHVLLLPVLLTAGAGSVEAKAGFEQRGLASWYGSRLHGKATASGEPMDRQRLTAAHRTLPFGTRVRVTNISTGQAVTLRINDRGPFIRGRIIDVSYPAAEKLGLLHRGVAKVKLEVVESPIRSASQGGASTPD